MRTFSDPTCVWLTLLLALWLSSAAFAACAAPQKPEAVDPCTIPADVRDDPPIQSGTPVSVAVGIVLVDLAEVNDRDETFRADILAELRWQDPRLNVKARGGSVDGCRLALDDIWHPDIRPLNMRAQARVLGEALRIDDTGPVCRKAL